jgi:hypothetical protein
VTGPQGVTGPAGTPGNSGSTGAQGATGAAASATMAVSAETSASATAPGTNSATVVLNASTSTARVCFLTHVKMQEIDASSEDGECRVTFDNVNGWRLTATADNPDAQVECRARCLSW